MKSEHRLTLRSYTNRKVAVALFVLLYLIVAFLGGQRSSRGEYFPAFNWSLYTRVHPVRSALELYVVRIGDKRFAKPILFADLGSYFAAAQSRSTGVKKTLERLGRTANAGDWQQFDKIRKVLETEYLSGTGPVQYEIHLVTFRPVERWRDGRILKRTLLARLTTGKSP